MLTASRIILFQVTLSGNNHFIENVSDQYILKASLERFQIQ